MTGSLSGPVSGPLPVRPAPGAGAVARRSQKVPDIATLAVGHRLPGRRVRLDRARLVQYAGASLDRNPIHWDEEHARRVGLPGVVAHGMLTMALAAEVVSDWVGAERIVEYRTRFTAPVPVPGDGTDLEINAVVTAIDPVDTRVTVGLEVLCGGEPVLGRASMTIRLGGSEPLVTTRRGEPEAASGPGSSPEER